MEPLNITYMHHKDATIVSVSFYVDEAHTVGWTGTGVAKRKKGDRPNEQVGKALALGRALQDLGSKVLNVFENA